MNFCAPVFGTKLYDITIFLFRETFSFYRHLFIKIAILNLGYHNPKTLTNLRYLFCRVLEFVFLAVYLRSSLQNIKLQNPLKILQFSIKSCDIHNVTKTLLSQILSMDFAEILYEDVKLMLNKLSLVSR